MSSADSAAGNSEIERLRNELKSTQDQLAALQAKHQRLAELLKCDPARVEHDLRNVLNELQLLRQVFEATEKGNG